MIQGSSSSRRAPLEGVRILAIEQLMALPFATQILADFGADVIGVEQNVYSGGGESIPWRLRTGRHKRRLVVDLRNGRGQHLVRDLARRADAVVENYRPGVLDKYGLGYSDLARDDPRLIYMSISGFGHRDLLPSPYTDMAGYGPIAEAVSGFTHTLLTNAGGGRSGVALGDIVTSAFSAVALLLALRERDRSGLGQYVDVAMVDCLFALSELPFVRKTLVDAGSKVLPPLTGILTGVFATSDGHFTTVVNTDRHWGLLADMLDKPEWRANGWADDTVEREKAMKDVIRPTFEAWCAALPLAEVVRRFRKAGIAIGPVLSPTEILADPHFAAREMIVQVREPDGTVVKVAGDPIKMSATPPRASMNDVVPIAYEGEQTAEILTEWLGMSAADVDALLRDGVVADRPPAPRP